MHLGPLEWHYIPTKYHEHLPSGLEVISGGTQTDRQTGDLIGLLSFLESRLKTGVPKSLQHIYARKIK
jgi:hypothetical protein